MLSLPLDILDLVCAEKETARALRCTCKYTAELVRGLFRVVVAGSVISLVGKYKKYDYAVNVYGGATYLTPMHREDALHEYIQSASYEPYCDICSGYCVSVPHASCNDMEIHVCDLGIAILGGKICAFTAKLVDEFTYIRAAFENIYNIDAAVMTFRGAPPTAQAIFLRKQGDFTRDPVLPSDGCMLVLSQI